MSPADLDPLQRAQLLLTVLDEGRRTATYKLALILALLDCSVAGVDSGGHAPAAVPTRTLAARVIELYWRQVRDRPGSTARSHYAQSTQRRAVTVDAVRHLWKAAQTVRATTLPAAATALPTLYAETLDTVELNLIQMPLGKLQRPAGFSETGARDYPRFLYDDRAFHEGVTERQLRARTFEVVFEDGVAAWLVSLSGLLRPLVELHWTRAVARSNRQELAEDRLREFLFGTERIGLGGVRDGLRDLQDGSCFYCGDRLPARGAQVDNFVPWSRLPNDALGNLVLADSRCNSSKRDHFADVPLLERWATRPRAGLEALADRRSWPLDFDRYRVRPRPVRATASGAAGLGRARSVPRTRPPAADGSPRPLARFEVLRHLCWRQAHECPFVHDPHKEAADGGGSVGPLTQTGPMTTTHPVLVLGEDAHVLLRCLQAAADSMRPTEDGRWYAVEAVLSGEDGRALGRALARLEAEEGRAGDAGHVLVQLLGRVLAGLGAAER